MRGEREPDMKLRNRDVFPIVLMRQFIAAISVILFFSGSADALPVKVNPEPALSIITSGPYTDGYSVAATGYAHTVYLWYQEKMGATWGPWRELRMDQNPALNTDAFKASVNAGTVRLDEWGNGANIFAGDATTLNAHTSGFPALCPPGGSSYCWRSAYNIGFDGNYVDVDVELQFNWTHSAFNNDVNKQNNLKTGWESSIERWWNKPDAKVTVIGPNGDVQAAYPIRFDVTLSGYTDGLPHNAGIFDQVIEVWDPNSTTKPFSRETMTAWFDTSGDQTVAHEFGHMLGNFDEYWGGGINTTTYLTDPDHLMGSLGGGMKTPYYEPFKLWLAGKDPADTFGLVLPEPPTWPLLLFSLAILGYTRRVLHSPSPNHNAAFRKIEQSR